MPMSRRLFLRSLAAGGTAWLAGTRAAGQDPVPLPLQIDRALSRVESLFLKEQSADGSWRSDHYAPFKDGASLTPLIVRTLVASAGRASDAACRKGADYIASFVKDGKVEVASPGLSYPLYTAAGAVQVLSHPSNARHLKARDAWLGFLRERQLTEALGWQPADKPYGGWGYCPTLPRKPKPGEPLPPLTESNLSATIYALDALRAAGVQGTDPASKKALVFVQRCQNYSDDRKQREEAYDDGGFFFIYDDPVRNKAGAAGRDRLGRERYHSYGSTTADGWRALLLCGRPADDPPVKAARAWMEANFRAFHHPGKFAQERETNRDAVYYYYVCSLTQTLLAAGLRELEGREGKIRWAEVLAKELLKRQREDGSWANQLVPQREDDPLVATSLAALALVSCRAVLPG